MCFELVIEVVGRNFCASLIVKEFVLVLYPNETGTDCDMWRSSDESRVYSRTLLAACKNNNSELMRNTNGSDVTQENCRTKCLNDKITCAMSLGHLTPIV